METMMKLTKVSEVLMAMQDQLTANGWRQQSYGLSNGPNCVVGASMALHTWYEISKGVQTETISFLDEFIRQYDREWQPRFDNHRIRMNVVVWNDDIARSFEEVHWMLSEAIAEAQEQERWGML